MLPPTRSAIYTNICIIIYILLIYLILNTGNRNESHGKIIHSQNNDNQALYYSKCDDCRHNCTFYVHNITV